MGARIPRLPAGQERPPLIGRNRRIELVRERIAQLVQTDASPVLITGETGTGKEIVAKMLHKNSGRRRAKLVAVNCSAVPPLLWESAFFGHGKGAFTGATRDRRGYVEAANTGTLFLDEISALPLELQPKLLRFLENGTYTRIGETRERFSNSRVIVASNRDLREMIDIGELRADLYFRLNAFEITLPPLRERGDDVILLAKHFIKQAAPKKTKRKTLSPNAKALLRRYPWPGNVRELRNVIIAVIVTVEDSRIEADHLAARLNIDPDANGEDVNNLASLAVIEKQHIEKALRQTSYNLHRSARILQIARNTLKRKIALHGLEMPPE